MRFAEVFLRLACSLVGWMLVYTYAVWLAALHAMGCGPEGDEMHRLLLGIMPFAVATALLLRMTRPFPDIQRTLSWLGMPLALLAPFMLGNIWVVLRRTHVDNFALCTNDAPGNIDLIWAPVQFFGVALIALIIVNVWRDARIEKP